MQSAPSVVRRRRRQGITIDGVSHTVAGVLEAAAATWWRSGLGVDRASARHAESSWPVRLQWRGPAQGGVTFDQAARDLNDISVRIFPIWAAGFRTASRVSFPSRCARDRRHCGKQVGLFAGAVALVLLLAIANVATLMLVRASAREHELAVRVALGAERHRVIRLILTECVVLTLMAGAAGLAIAVTTLGLVGVVAPGLPRLSEVALDGRSIAFATAVALLSGVLVSLAPLTAIFSRRSPVSAGVLSSPARGGLSRRSNAIRGALVIAELRSPCHFCSAPACWPTASFACSGSMPALIRAAWWGSASRFHPCGTRTTLSCRSGARPRRGLAVDGVAAAGVTSSLPRQFRRRQQLRPARPAGAHRQGAALRYAVTPGYFDALRIPLRRGRLLELRDGPAVPRVVVINESFARRKFPVQDPIGKRLRFGADDSQWYTIVGVVGDVLYQGLAGDGVAVYAPIAQDQPRSLTLVVRSTASASAALRALRKEVTSLDPALAPPTSSWPKGWMTHSVTRGAGHPWSAHSPAPARSRGTRHLRPHVLCRAPATSRDRHPHRARRHPQDLVLFVLQRGMSYALVGTVLGLAVSALESRWLGSLLYEVQASDPLTTALAVAAYSSRWWRASCLDFARHEHGPLRRSQQTEKLTAAAHGDGS
jgi:hypothetical protein